VRVKFQVHFFLLPYTLFTLLLPFAYHLFLLHLLSTNHKFTEPCYFPLLLKHANQKKMDWNSSMRNSTLCAAPVAIPVELWSLPLFHFTESDRSS
jgi:hypothetical protein